MAKPEWGIKRVCHACGALFYDFHKSPIICPACKAEFDPEAVLKSRRNRAPIAEPVKNDEVDPKVAVVESEDVGDAVADDLDESADETGGILADGPADDDDADGDDPPVSMLDTTGDGDDEQPLEDDPDEI